MSRIAFMEEEHKVFFQGQECSVGSRGPRRDDTSARQSRSRSRYSDDRSRRFRRAACGPRPKSRNEVPRYIAKSLHCEVIVYRIGDPASSETAPLDRARDRTGGQARGDERRVPGSLWLL